MEGHGVGDSAVAVEDQAGNARIDRVIIGAILAVGGVLATGLRFTSPLLLLFSGCPGNDNMGLQCKLSLRPGPGASGPALSRRLGG